MASVRGDATEAVERTGRMPRESRVDVKHLLLIGAGRGVGAAVARRFGREGFRATLISRGGAAEEVAAGLRDEGMSMSPLVSDVGALDGFRATLHELYDAPDRPGVLAYNPPALVPARTLPSTLHH